MGFWILLAIALVVIWLHGNISYKNDKRKRNQSFYDDVVRFIDSQAPDFRCAIISIKDHIKDNKIIIRTNGKHLYYIYNEHGYDVSDETKASLAGYLEKYYNGGCIEERQYGGTVYYYVYAHKGLNGFHQHQARLNRNLTRV